MNVLNRWQIIINPTAGNGQGKKKWANINQLLQKAGIQFDHTFSVRRGHAAVIARNAARQGYRKIIAVGGDGTNNEVMNGIMKQQVVPSNEMTYSIIPVGTGNDWIKTHQIPKNTQKVIDIIKKGKTKCQDIGLVTYLNDGQQGRRYFMNVAGMAYDAFVAKASEERQSFTSNQIMYLYLVMSCLRSFTPPRGRVYFDNKTDEDNYYLVNIGICKYSGGGMQFVPHAVCNDGQFALTIARNFSTMEIIKAVPKFYNGKCGDHPKVDLYHAKSIRVESIDKEPILLEVDGEFLGGTPVEFTLLKKALRIVVP